jgi:exopolysaccharide production protein ExoZ
MLKVLQAGRAFAAFAVLLHHAAASTAYVLPVPDWLRELGDRSIGFNFFFVLSGFIILYAHGSDQRGTGPAGLFLYKRTTRIFGPYLPVVIGLMLLYLLLPNLSRGQTQWGLFSTLTLIPTHQPPALSVAWTLQHELIFYTIFLLFYFIRPFAVVVAAWGIAICGLWMSGLWAEITIPILTVALHPLNLMFIAGMIAAVLVKRVGDHWWWLPLLIGAAGAVGFLLAPETLVSRVGFGLAMAPLTMGAIMLERAGRIRIPDWLVALGGASYAIYLVHNNVVGLVARGSSLVAPWQVTLVACIVVGAAAGLAYHYAVERPLVRYFKSRLTGPTRR